MEMQIVNFNFSLENEENLFPYILQYMVNMLFL